MAQSAGLGGTSTSAGGTGAANTTIAGDKKSKVHKTMLDDCDLLIGHAIGTSILLKTSNYL